MKFLDVDFSTYEEGACYRTEHLQWISNRKTFIPYRLILLEQSYLEVMKDLYTKRKVIKTIGNVWDDNYTVIKGKEPMVSNRMAFEFYMKDKQYAEYIAEKKKTKDGIIHKYFITLNFNHKTFDPKRCMELVKTFPKYTKWFKGYVGKFEFFRRDKTTKKIYEHPHFHFILETACGFPNSKLVEKIFAVKDMKKYVDTKNYIQIDKYGPWTKDYMNGIKTEEKMECVEKDVSWRKKNNIPDFFGDDNYIL